MRFNLSISKLSSGWLGTVVFAFAVLWPLHLVAADDSIDPSLIPDGTYPAHVEHVISEKRLEVTMQGTLKVFLDAGLPNMNFPNKIKSNDDISVTLTGGKITAFTKK
jgi:hypothetical protein